MTDQLDEEIEAEYQLCIKIVDEACDSFIVEKRTVETKKETVQTIGSVFADVPGDEEEIPAGGYPDILKLGDIVPSWFDWKELSDDLGGISKEFAEKVAAEIRDAAKKYKVVEYYNSKEEYLFKNYEGVRK